MECLSITKARRGAAGGGGHNLDQGHVLPRRTPVEAVTCLSPDNKVWRRSEVAVS